MRVIRTWRRQHGVFATGRPACVCRGSVGRFLAGGSFARELSSSSGSAGSSVQKRCSGPAAGRGPSLHRRVSRREPVCQRSAPGLWSPAAAPPHTPQTQLRPRSNSEFMHQLTLWSRPTAGKKPNARNGHSYLTPRCPIITRKLAKKDLREVLQS